MPRPGSPSRQTAIAITTVQHDEERDADSHCTNLCRPRAGQRHRPHGPRRRLCWLGEDPAHSPRARGRDIPVVRGANDRLST